jgi:hypothetical protein
MSGLKENGMSNGEILAAVNKIHNQKSRTLKTFSSGFSGYYKGSFTPFWLSKVELDQGNKVDRYKV